MQKLFKHTFFGLLLTLFTANFAANAQYLVKNQGQWKTQVEYKLPMHYGGVYFETDGITVQQADPEGAFYHEKTHHFDAHNHQTYNPPKTQKYHAYKMSWVNANPKPNLQPSEKLDTYHNYILGNNPQKWQSKVPLYMELEYQELYPGINIKLHFNESGNLKYDVEITPNANPNLFKTHYQGAGDIAVSEEGNLLIHTSISDVQESKPYAYQVVGGQKVEIACSYELQGDTVGFSLGAYDKSLPLIIDPELVFSTFISSSSSVFGHSATPGVDGSSYSAGIIFDGRYPTTMGAYQDTFGGGSIDVGISKLSSDGSQLLYSTFLGGSLGDMPYSIIEDETDRSLFIFGVTGSDDFPVDSATAMQGKFAGGTPRPADNYFPSGTDFFVAKLDSTGGNLLNSTYWGGSQNDGYLATSNTIQFDGNDKYRGEVSLDDMNHIYVTGYTSSGDFPTTTNSAQSSKNLNRDAVAASFDNNLSNVRWSTYFGGSSEDVGNGIRTFGTNTYVVGTTSSIDLTTHVESLQPQNMGGIDGFLLHLDSRDGSFYGCTYIGSSAKELFYFVDINSELNPVVLGFSRGSVSDTNVGFSSKNNGLIIREYNSTLDSLKHSVTVGSDSSTNNTISPTAFEIDDCDNILLGAFTSVDFLPVTLNAEKQHPDDLDFYFFILDASWNKMNYGTYFGGKRSGDPSSYGEHVDGGTSRFSDDGTIYQAVCASCGDQVSSAFPTTPNSYGSSKGSGRCNMAVIKFSTNVAEVEASLTPKRDTVCQFELVELIDSSFNADYFIVRSPDGTSTRVDSATQVEVKNLGLNVYSIIAIDSTCGNIDSTKVEIFGVDFTDQTNFTYQYDSCDENSQTPLKVSFFTNLDNGYQATWSFGDGDSSQASNPVHFYPEPGTYTVHLSIESEACPAPIVSSKTFTLHPVSPIGLDIQSIPCTDGSVNLQANGRGYQQYQWLVNGTLASTANTFDSDFKEGGTYNILLVANDSVCKRADTVTYAYEYKPAEIPVRLPNVFTPNGDGQNDFFGVIGDLPNEQFKSFSLEVYNRWGQLVFTANSPSQKWDGIQQTDVLPQGVYYYLVNYLSSCDLQSTEKGYVHLLR